MHSVKRVRNVSPPDAVLGHPGTMSKNAQSPKNSFSEGLTAIDIDTVEIITNAVRRIDTIDSKDISLQGGAKVALKEAVEDIGSAAEVLLMRHRNKKLASAQGSLSPGSMTQEIARLTAENKKLNEEILYMRRKLDRVSKSHNKKNQAMRTEIGSDSDQLLSSASIVFREDKCSTPRQTSARDSGHKPRKRGPVIKDSRLLKPSERVQISAKVNTDTLIDRDLITRVVEETDPRGAAYSRTAVGNSELRVGCGRTGTHPPDEGGSDLGGDPSTGRTRSGYSRRKPRLGNSGE